MFLHSLALRCVLVLLVLSALLTGPATAATYFTQVPAPPVSGCGPGCTGPRWSARAGSFNFKYAGTLWVLGGYTQTSSNSGGTVTYSASATSDLWYSEDLGRTWTKYGNLPSSCTASTGSAVLHAGSMYMQCAGYYLASGTLYATTTSTYKLTAGTTPATATLATLSTNYPARAAFTVSAIAAPFDGVGTIIATGGIDSSHTAYNDVWWYSTTGALATGSPTLASQNKWIQVTLTNAWSPRIYHSTVADVEGLVLILAGGIGPTTTTLTTTGTGTVLSDVWQVIVLLTYHLTTPLACSLNRAP